MTLKLPTLVEGFSRQGFTKPNQPNKGNEDRIVITERVFAVIDGATAMVPHKLDGLTAAAYIARYIGRELASATADDCVTAADLLLSINASFATHLAQHYPHVAAEGKYGPSAAAVVVKLHDDGTYTYAQVADCFLLEEKARRVALLTPDQLDALDTTSLQDAKRRLLEGVSPEHILQDPEVRALLKANRLQNNVVFGVVNGEPDMAKHLCHGRRSLDGVTALVLMSDGMCQPDVPVRASSAIVSAASMLDQGLSPHYRYLKVLYDTDPGFLLFLRFKHMDDASAILLRF